jgi:branched-chain amino acid transport system permease protein
MRFGAGPIVLVAALLACFGVNAMSDRMNVYYVDVALNVGIAIVMAVSLNLINGYTGQFSLGHAGFMAVGAYGAAAVSKFAGSTLLPAFAFLGQNGSQAAVFFLALLTGGSIAALAGFIVGTPSLKLKGDYLAIVTLGFGEIISVIFRNVPALGGALGLTGIPNYTNLFWAFGAAAVTIYVVLTMVHSTYGRGFIAVHDDEVAAQAMGINTTRYKIIAFVVGAFFAGVGGGLFGHSKMSITPTGFGFMLSIEYVVMVILGGMGNTFGVILAAILLTLLPEFLRQLADYRMIIYSVALILLMLTRPQGLFNFRRPAWMKRRTA